MWTHCSSTISLMSQGSSMSLLETTAFPDGGGKALMVEGMIRYRTLGLPPPCDECAHAHLSPISATRAPERIHVFSRTRRTAYTPVSRSANGTFASDPLSFPPLPPFSPPPRHRPTIGIHPTAHHGADNPHPRHHAIPTALAVHRGPTALQIPEMEHPDLTTRSEVESNERERSSRAPLTQRAARPP